MLDQKVFAEVLCNWLMRTIKPNIAAENLVMRGALAALTGVLRVRPNLISAMALEYFPWMGTLRIFADGKVDTDVAVVALHDFFDEIGEYDIGSNEQLKWFTYKVSRDEVNALCEGLVKASSTQKTATHNNT